LLEQPSWRHDIPASLVVFFVAVPLGLGVALTSGVPMIAGIIAGIVGGLVVGALSGSALMVSGPAAGMSVVVLGVLADLGSFERLLAAVVLAGLMQVAFSAMRAGVVGYFFPSPVIKGMLAAIGLILVLKQIPHALGYDVDAMGSEAFVQRNSETTFSALGSAFTHIEPGAIAIALFCLAVYGVWGRGPLSRLKTVPASAAVVVLGTVAYAFLSEASPMLRLSASHFVALPVPATPGEFFANTSTPELGAFFEVAVWGAALVLAVVASLESLLALQGTDDLDPHKREASPDRELFAQGVGNVLSGALGGLPVTGVVVRSATNITAGARTRWSSILHGLWLLLAVALAPALLNRIPLAVLATVLIVVGSRLAHPRIFRDALRHGRAFAVPFYATVVSILLTDLLRGILAGLTVGVVLILRDHVRTPPFTEVSPAGAVLRRLRLHENLNFLHKAALLAELDAVPPRSRIEVDARGTRRIDPDVREVLFNFHDTARLREIDYRLVGITPPTT
jgi:MFS superfamily sulfate permease-like transporter